MQSFHADVTHSYLCSAAAAAAAIAKPAARPSSFLQAAGGSTPGDGSRAPAGAPQPGRGGAPGAGAGRGRGRAPPRAPPVTVPNEDFDFEEMMKKFNKQAAVKVGFRSGCFPTCNAYVYPYACLCLPCCMLLLPLLQCTVLLLKPTVSWS